MQLRISPYYCDFRLEFRSKVGPRLLGGALCDDHEKGFDMKTKNGLFAALILSTMLAACATTGTRVSTTSDTYRDLAKGQQTWCGAFGDTCTCYLDGIKTTCSLVFACLNSGNCKAAQ